MKERRHDHGVALRRARRAVRGRHAYVDGRVKAGSRRVHGGRGVYGLRGRAGDGELRERASRVRILAVAQVRSVEDVQTSGLRRCDEQARRLRAGGERDEGGRRCAEVQIARGAIPRLPFRWHEQTGGVARERGEPLDAHDFLRVGRVARDARRIAGHPENVGPIGGEPARAPYAGTRTLRRPPADLRRVVDVHRDDPSPVRAAVAVGAAERNVEDVVHQQRCAVLILRRGVELRAAGR